MSDAKIGRCLTLALVAFHWAVLGDIQIVNANVERYACQYTNCTYRSLDSEQAKSPSYAADYQHACNDPQSPEEADLCQQWRMAEATDMAAEIAASQLRATFAEIAFLIFTVAFTGWAAYAASNAASAADRSISVGRELGERQIRAYVGVIGAEVTNFVVGEAFRFDIIIRNSGQSPALQVAPPVTAQTISSTKHPEFDFSNMEANQSRGDLGAGQKIGTGGDWPDVCTRLW